MKAISARRLWVARGLAVAADALEFGLGAVFAEGIASPLADGLDMVMCVLMTWLLGWHLAFLPTIAVKLLPVIDLAPCWTIAVLIATRKSGGRDLYHQGTKPPRDTKSIKGEDED